MKFIDDENAFRRQLKTTSANDLAEPNTAWLSGDGHTVSRPPAYRHAGGLSPPVVARKHGCICILAFRLRLELSGLLSGARRWLEWSYPAALSANTVTVRR